MTAEKKQEFTLRITQANKSELVVILYELFFYYIDEAKQEAFYTNSFQEQDEQNRNTEMNHNKIYRDELKKAHDCLNELIASLNMEQELANSIFNVYLFVSRQIGLAVGSGKTIYLDDAILVMKKLYNTYKEDAKSDTSKAVMNHTQTVYAGLTYGKNSLNENLEDGSMQRGFFV